MTWDTSWMATTHKLHFYLKTTYVLLHGLRSHRTNSCTGCCSLNLPRYTDLQTHGCTFRTASVRGTFSLPEPRLAQASGATPSKGTSREVPQYIGDATQLRTPHLEVLTAQVRVQGSGAPGLPSLTVVVTVDRGSSSLPHLPSSTPPRLLGLFLWAPFFSLAG